jgi:parvulin-like peptidyl-prolyl isomerase
MKRSVRVFLVFLAVILVIGTVSLAEEDPVIVRVGDITFTKSQIQPSLMTDISLVELVSGTYLTDEEKQAQREETIDRYVGVALIQMKLRQLGKNDFTSEEEESMKSAARNQYEQIWQGIWAKAQQSDEKFTEEQVTESMEEMGYTINALYEEYKASERKLRLIEVYCPNLTLTEDMVETYYRENFLDPDKERYGNNLDLYEQEILAEKNESFYTPEGYRAIQQILLDYPDEVTKGLKNERARCNRATEALASALQTLAMAATTAAGWDDMAEPRAAYDEAAAETETAMKEYTEKREKLTLPLIQETADAIQTEYEAGTDFNSLIKKYSTDKSETNTEGGYPVHPDSQNWSPEFIEAVMSMERPGDISGPVLTDLGIHILYYASDIPGGEHELTGTERELLNASALNYYQGLELEKLLEGWKQDYEIETHPELLDD